MVTIGGSGLDVYPLCLGGNTFGWTSSEEDSRKVLDGYVDAGGNFIDTADVYSAWAEGNNGGESEAIIGKWLKPSKRDDLVIATKVGMWETRAGLSRQNIHNSVEGSLRRLRTDYVDLYYAHVFDDEADLEQTVTAFAELQDRGLVRHVGVSNISADELSRWVKMADSLGVPRPVALQPHYNLVWRTDYEKNLQPVVEEFNLGVMPYQALAAGLLTGKYSADKEPKGERARAVNRHASPQAYEVVKVVEQVASELNVEPAAVAVAWLLTNPTVTAPVASARTSEQLSPLLEGVTITLTKEEVDALNSASAGLGD